jgi:hypothetical protein
VPSFSPQPWFIPIAQEPEQKPVVQAASWQRQNPAQVLAPLGLQALPMGSPAGGSGWHNPVP